MLKKIQVRFSQKAGMLYLLLSCYCPVRAAGNVHFTRDLTWDFDISYFIKYNIKNSYKIVLAVLV
jgi:hypothetical protein